MIMTTDQYLDLKATIIRAGYQTEIHWSEYMQPVADSLNFWREFAWVVLNSGMKNQIALQIWRKVRPVVETGGSAGSVFGHKGKSAAIDYVFANRGDEFLKYTCALDKVSHLQSLPWIGEITCWHLAKNLGVDCAKPDRHLVRIAGTEGTHALCARLAKATGDRIATVDLVIWRAANLGFV